MPLGRLPLQSTACAESCGAMARAAVAALRPASTACVGWRRPSPAERGSRLAQCEHSQKSHVTHLHCPTASPAATVRSHTSQEPAVRAKAPCSDSLQTPQTPSALEATPAAARAAIRLRGARRACFGFGGLASAASRRLADAGGAAWGSAAAATGRPRARSDGERADDTSASAWGGCRRPSPAERSRPLPGLAIFASVALGMPSRLLATSASRRRRLREAKSPRRSRSASSIIASCPPSISSAANASTKTERRDAVRNVATSATESLHRLQGAKPTRRVLQRGVAARTWGTASSRRLYMLRACCPRMRAWRGIHGWGEWERRGS